MDAKAAVLSAGVYAASVLLVLASAAFLRRRIPRLPAAAIAVLPVLFCAPGFFAGRTLLPTDHVRNIPPWSGPAGVPAPPRHNPNLNDAVTQIAPWTQAVRLAWREGSLPWNDRWNGCGTPLAANGQSGAFSPFTLLLFPLALADAFTVGAAVKLLLALSGTFLWVREMEVSIPAALFASVSFAFSLTMTPWLLFPLSAVFCLWPWALFAVELAMRPDPGARAAAALVAVPGAWVLIGHPESAVLGAAAIGLFLAARVILKDPRLDRARLFRVAAAAGAAAALTAFLWVPQILAVRASNRLAVAGQLRRALPASAAPHAPAWPAGFLMPVFPRALGDDVAAPLAAGAVSSFPEMALPYFGVVGAALVLLLVLPGAERDRRSIAAAVPLAAGLLVGTGTWPVFDTFVAAPVLGLVSPLRPLSWVALMGSAVAAFELDRVGRTFAARKVPRLIVAAAPATAGAAALAGYLRGAAAAAAGPGPALAEALATALISLAALGVLLFLWRSRPRASAGVTLGLAAVASAELFAQGIRLYAWGDRRDAFPQTPLTRFLESRPRPFRIVGADAALFPGTNVFAGVEDVRVHDAIERRNYVTLLDRTAGYPPAEYFKRIRNLDASILDFLNVRYLVTAGGSPPSARRWSRVYDGLDGAVFENARAMPRVFAPAAVLEGSEAAAWPADPASVTLLSSWRPRGAPSFNPAVEISDYSETANAVTFRARHGSGPGGEGAVVVASLVQDGGWSARDERNKALPEGVANSMFLALLVPPGDHRVRIDYRPPGLREGGAISAAGLAVIAAAVLGRLAARRRRLA